MLHGVAIGDIGALGNDSFEETLASFDERQERDAGRACRLAENRHVVRIAAEPGDVLLNPPEGLQLVQQAEVAGLLEVLSARDPLEVHEAQEAEPVVNGHEQDVGALFGDIGQVIQGRSLGFCAEAAAVNPYHDRLPAVRAAGIGIDVQHEAVLAELRRPPRVVCGADGHVAGLGRVVHAVIVGGREGLLPTKLPHRLRGVGDALPDNQFVCLFADEGAVVTLDCFLDFLLHSWLSICLCVIIHSCHYGWYTNGLSLTGPTLPPTVTVPRAT